MKTVHLRVGAEAEPVEVTIQKSPDGEPFAVTVNGRQRQVGYDPLGPGAGVLRLEGHVLPVHAVRRGSSIQVWMRGRTWMLELVEQTARRAADAGSAAAKATLTAPMPGTILSIRVRVGGLFAAHEPLIVMESMKMEMTLSAPHAGRIAALHCREGDLVEMNAVLARLEGEASEGGEEVTG